jgi:hypothetical protein
MRVLHTSASEQQRSSYIYTFWKYHAAKTIFKSPKYSPHNAFGISDVIISHAVFQFKVKEVNIQLALSHETNAAIHNTTVMCVYKSWVNMLKRDISECYEHQNWCVAATYSANSHTACNYTELKICVFQRSNVKHWPKYLCSLIST